MFPLRDNVARTHEPIVVFIIIAANVAVFLFQLSLGPRELDAFLLRHALIPLRYFSSAWAAKAGLPQSDLSPFITCLFLHGGFFHLIVNMWTLWIFGPALEDRMGPGRFAALYMLAGIAASATHALFNIDSAIPVIGASGAIAGVIAAYAARFPYAWVRVLVLIVIIPLFFSVPAVAFAGIWFFSQVLQGTTELFSPSSGAGIAWWAHIGGFLAGWGLLYALEPPRQPAVRYLTEPPRS